MALEKQANAGGRKRINKSDTFKKTDTLKMDSFYYALFSN